MELYPLGNCLLVVYLYIIILSTINRKNEAILYRKPKANRQKPIRIANIISYNVLEAFVFNNSDVYNSILNEMNKKIKLETILYRINALKRRAADWN